MAEEQKKVIETTTPETTTPVKRGRGRPKGSKTKNRKVKTEVDGVVVETVVTPEVAPISIIVPKAKIPGEYATELVVEGE